MTKKKIDRQVCKGLIFYERDEGFSKDLKLFLRIVFANGFHIKFGENPHYSKSNELKTTLCFCLIEAGYKKYEWGKHHYANLLVYYDKTSGQIRDYNVEAIKKLDEGKWRIINTYIDEILTASVMIIKADKNSTFADLSRKFARNFIKPNKWRALR